MNLLVRERAPPHERWSRENRPSGSTSGKWKRSMAELVRHRQTKGPATDRLDLNHRATSRLYCAARKNSAVEWEGWGVRKAYCRVVR